MSWHIVHVFDEIVPILVPAEHVRILNALERGHHRVGPDKHCGRHFLLWVNYVGLRRLNALIEVPEDAIPHIVAEVLVVCQVEAVDTRVMCADQLGIDALNQDDASNVHVRIIFENFGHFKGNVAA